MKLKNILKNNNENNRQYVYRVLKENIMNLHLEPGEAISESEIGDHLNVSRTPIREAIVRLGEERLLNVIPQKGSYVSKIDLELINESIFMRKTLEKEVLKVSLKKGVSKEFLNKLEENLHFQRVLLKMEEDQSQLFHLDNKFHEIIFREYGYSNIWSAIKQFNTHYDRLRLLDAMEKTTTKEILMQHNSIILFLKGDNSDINSIIDGHLCNFTRVLSHLKEKFPNYFNY